MTRSALLLSAAFLLFPLVAGQRPAAAETAKSARADSIPPEIVRRLASLPVLYPALESSSGSTDREWGSRMLEALRMVDAFEGLSSIEERYAIRLGEELPQFGYDLIEGATLDQRTVVARLADHPLRLSCGDRLSVTLKGAQGGHWVLPISVDGTILLPGSPSETLLPAADRTAADVQADISDALNLPLSAVAVTLAALPPTEIRVLGHVPRPGAYHLSQISALPDALAAAGGVRKSGSLRRVRLIRDGQTRLIDLYGFLTGRGDADVLLRDGDVIVVPPIGRTAAIAGAVRRPGIYELIPGDKTDTPSLVTLAGGLVDPSHSEVVALPANKEREPILVAMGKGGGAFSP